MIHVRRPLQVRAHLSSTTSAPQIRRPRLVPHASGQHDKLLDADPSRRHTHPGSTPTAFGPAAPTDSKQAGSIPHGSAASLPFSPSAMRGSRTDRSADSQQVGSAVDARWPDLSDGRPRPVVLLLNPSVEAPTPVYPPRPVVTVTNAPAVATARATA